MNQIVKLACPLDCFDACGLLAEVVDGRVVRLKGNPDHPLTRGRICTKGKRLLERLYHPQRLLAPRLKNGRHWDSISWEEALDLMARRFADAIRDHGRHSILYYADSGYGGLAKSVDHLFFQHLGGVSIPRGSLCWGAGMAAQRYDFGDVRGHAPQDLAKARCIVIWGRNPVATNPHLVPFLQQARRRGARLIVIDPLKTLSARQADIHLQPQPGTDGALALGMAHHLLASGRIAEPFITRHTRGFKRFAETLKGFTPEHAAAITGLEADTIRQTAAQYADQSPASMIIGIGLQRYTNGGNTVRCIDALGAMTGNIGRSGGGVNYANRSITRWIDRHGGTPSPPFGGRTFPLPRMAHFIRSAKAPPIAVMMIAKANPLVQMPDTRAMQEAFARVPFKIVSDMFMTDTAQAADLVLPCTSILEEEDLVFSSMFSPYLNFASRAVAPPDGMLGEYELFRHLAGRMKLSDYPDIPARTFLQNAIRPLTREFGVTLDRLRAAPFKLPDEDIPWSDGQFATPSGRYEFYSSQARDDGGPPLPTYIPPRLAPAAYPFRLLTPHHAHSLHSQHFAFRQDRPEVAIHPDEARQQGLKSGQVVRVVSSQGQIRATLTPDAAVVKGVIKIDQGWWQHSGAVNRLTAATLSDMGENAAYYETFCRVEPDEKRPGDPRR
ncbi:MAG: molybdopterin-dependent oxidoreductase [Desulfobacterales bacterium]|jgi:anaerobic selenocysteine-containing dehydrogenase